MCVCPSSMKWNCSSGT